MKLDGFRALAIIEGHQCRLISRNGHRFSKWPYLEVEIAQSIRASRAILDGEMVCLDDDGTPNFHKLLFRRDWPFFYALRDMIELEGEDLRGRALIERKKILRSIMPTIESRLRYLDHIEPPPVSPRPRLVSADCTERLRAAPR